MLLFFLLFFDSADNTIFRVLASPFSVFFKNSVMAQIFLKKVQHAKSELTFHTRQQPREDEC